MPPFTPALYLFQVLILGASWFAVTLQLGVVDPVLSVAVRTALAGMALLGWCLIRRKDLAFLAHDHVWMGVQGALMYGVGLIALYRAVELLPSALVAVVFSTVLAFNLIFARILFAAPVRFLQLIGIAVVLGGIALIASTEIHYLLSTDRAYVGLTYALAATASTSLGNMVSARHLRRGLPALQTHGYALLYAGAFVFIYGFWTQTPLRPDTSIAYISSLMFLALIATALAVVVHVHLIGRLGAGREAMVLIAQAVVAFGVSAGLEQYTPSLGVRVGAALIVIGNIMILLKKNQSVSA